MNCIECFQELTATTRGAGMMGSTDDNANKTDGMVQESQLIEVDDDDEDEDDGDDDKGEISNMIELTFIILYVF